MSHKLQKFYGPLSGLNTRENKLTLDPNAFRTGSKNFRFNFLDEIQKANGFQHKSIYGFTSAGDIEYKYTDIDTGASKFQHLAVGTDGNLYRKYYQYISFVSLGTATTYSFYYDEVLDSYVLKFNSYSAISVSETMTMDQLRVAINALGPSCNIVDENGSTVTGSTKLAYLMDVAVDQSLSTGTIDEMNVQYWEKVPSGGGYTDVPFTTTRDFYSNDNYQGISSVNINNVCIITDGGWPMKYDGLVVYRAGQPKILAPRQADDPKISSDPTGSNFSGITLLGDVKPDGFLDPEGTYKYVFQLCSVDANGSTSVGGYDIGNTNLYIKKTLTKGQNAISIFIPSFSGNFSWFRCRIKGGQNIPDAGGTIDVYPNHNLIADQTLRIPISNKQLTGYFGSATTTSGSAVVTGLVNTSRMQIGSIITGTGIATDSRVLSIDSATQITMSKNATATGNIIDFKVFGINGFSYLMTKIVSVSYGYSGSAVISNGSAVITGLSDTSLINVGALVEAGLAFPANTRVLSIDSATQITVSANATLNTTSLTVYGTVQAQIGKTETSSYGPNTTTQYPFQSFAINQSVNITSGSTSMTVNGSTSASFSLTTNTGSNVVTVSTGPGSEVRVGMYVRHAHLPNTAKVTQVNSATEFLVSANATNTGAATGVLMYDYQGYYVEGNGLAAGTFITSQNATTATITPAATGSYTLEGRLFHKEKTLLIDGQTVTGGYTSSQYQNTITDVNVENLFLPEVFQGSFIRVWRTTKNTELFYHLIDLDIPLAPFTFYDTLPDTAAYLGSTQPAPWTLSRVSLTDAVQGSELPRACKYLAKWQDRLVQMGRPVNTLLKDETYPTFDGGVYNNDWDKELTSFIGSTYTESALCDFQSIYWSSSESNESFPQDGLHEFLIESNANDQITGGSQNKDAFFAFKSRSTGVLVGSLAENNLQLELLESEIGCSSHRSIQEVAGALIWLDQDNGFYSCVAGRLPVPIGFPISDYQQLNLQKLDYTKAVSGLYRKENLYFCAVGTTTFVYDYVNQGPKDRSCWYLWDRFDTKSFLQSSTGEFFLSDGSKQWKMKVTNTKYDFTDHKSAIPMVVNTSWLTQGAPTIDKQFINLWVNSIQGGFTLDFYQYQNFLDYSISELLGVSFLAESSTKKLVKVQFKAANPKISGVSFGMQNNVKNAFVRIQGFEVEYAAAFDSGEPKK